MQSIYGEPILGPTDFNCSCGGQLYVEKSSYLMVSEPNNFYCTNCGKREIVDEETLMEEYYKILYGKLARMRFENWKKEQEKKYNKKKY